MIWFFVLVASIVLRCLRYLYAREVRISKLIDAQRAFESEARHLRRELVLKGAELLRLKQDLEVFK